MRHRVRNAKLGRNPAHRNALVANLVKSLIKHKRITTTLSKAKAAAPVAEKMITLAKSGKLHDRRLASARLQYQSRSAYDHKSKKHREAYRKYHDVIHILFDELGPQFKERNGGYTRIVRLADKRRGDAGEQAILMWVTEGLDGSSASSTAETDNSSSGGEQQDDTQG
jgi:large subunit ribosomal protein L17